MFRLSKKLFSLEKEFDFSKAFEKIVLNRKSVRNFKPDAIEYEKLSHILALTQRAPSSLF
jgi:nitroreductase